MWYWWVSGIGSLLLSTGCMASTLRDLKRGKSGPSGPKAAEFWGAVAFHGITAVLGFWLLSRAIF